MAIVLYLYNQNVLLQRGVRAQMGHMGGWIELTKQRSVQTRNEENAYNRTMTGLPNLFRANTRTLRADSL